MTSASGALLRRPALIGAIGISAAYLAAVTVLCKIEDDCFFYGFDLVWYANLLAWGKGKWPFFSTLNGYWFGDHFEPIGLSLVPIFQLFPNRWTLLLTQNLAFASVPLLCFLLAARLLGSDRRALLVALVSVASPGLWYINLYDFHWTTLTIPLVLAYFLFLELRHSTAALVCLGLMLLCKEDAALLVVPLSIPHYLTFRRPGVFVAVAGGAAAVFVALNVWLLPAIGSPPAIQSWRYLGGSFDDIVRTLLSRPGVLPEHVLIRPNAEYLLELLLPWSFVSLLDWRLWLGAPVFATFALAAGLTRHTVASQSAAMLIPCVAVSALYGLRRALRAIERLPRGAEASWLALSGMLVIALLCFPRPLPGRLAQRPHVRLVQGGLPLWRSREICPERQQLEAITALIPDDRDVSVVSESRLAPRFVHHAWLKIYGWPRQAASDYADYDFVIGSRVDSATRGRRPFHAAGGDARWRSLAADPRWEQIYADSNGYFVLRNRHPEVEHDAVGQ